VRLFFYAGHGLQFRGRNYLVPVDAHIAIPEDIPTEAVEIQGLTDHLQRGNKGLNIIILDACRNYPSSDKWARGTRGVVSALPAAGLAEIEAPRGTVIAFSTAPGAVAKDGASQHSVYAKHLLASLDVPGLTLEQLFKRVRTGVLGDTNQLQTPWENSSLVGNFCFHLGPRGECPISDSVSSPIAIGVRR
jgi:uncharacterized caspase-like protein